MTTRRELIDAVAARYRAAGRNQKKEILDEFVNVTGFHRKHAIRVLKTTPRRETPETRQRARIYDEAIRETLTIVWEAADRICGKRLRQVIVHLGNYISAENAQPSQPWKETLIATDSQLRPGDRRRHGGNRTWAELRAWLRSPKQEHQNEQGLLSGIRGCWRAQAARRSYR